MTLLYDIMVTYIYTPSTDLDILLLKTGAVALFTVLALVPYYILKVIIQSFQK